MHYYTFNIGDYRRDTVHLTLLEHGIYRQLLDTYYLNEQPLPDDDAWLMRTHCARTPDEMQALKNVLRDFFDLEDGFWHHKGCEKLIGDYRRKSEKASASAKARWEKDANALPTQSESNADGMLTINHKPITNNQVITLPKGRESESKIPPCPHQEIVDLFHKTLPELPKVIVWNKVREGYLRARWREVAVEKGWKSQEEGIEYFQNFFGFVRTSKFLMGKVSGNGKRPFECELEWLLRPSNFVKVIEGKYHAA